MAGAIGAVGTARTNQPDLSNTAGALIVGAGGLAGGAYFGSRAGMLLGAGIDMALGTAGIFVFTGLLGGVAGGGAGAYFGGKLGYDLLD
jgi:hypothetical protein